MASSSINPLTLIRQAIAFGLPEAEFPRLFQQVQRLSPSNVSAALKERQSPSNRTTLLPTVISFASDENHNTNWKHRAQRVLEVLIQLLPAEELNDSDAEGRSLLHQVIQAQVPPRIISLLLERGANPDLQDNQGRTPLVYAALYSTAEVARSLLDHEADLDLTNKNGRKPADYLKERTIDRQHIPALRVVLGNQEGPVMNNQNQNQNLYGYYNNGDAAMNNYYNQYYNEINRYGYDGGKRKGRKGKSKKTRALKKLRKGRKGQKTYKRRK